MIPGNVRDTGNGGFEQFLLFKVVESLKHLLPILIDPILKLFLVTYTGRTDHVDALGLYTILTDMIID